MQIFLTVISGVLVFVLGQIVLKFVVDPIQEFYWTTGEVADSLTYYANIYSNPDVCSNEKLAEVQESLRRLATKLLARVHVIPMYRLWAFMKVVPQREDVAKAGGYIIGLSNNLRKSVDAAEENSRRRDAIQRLLKIDVGN